MSETPEVNTSSQRLCSTVSDDSAGLSAKMNALIETIKSQSPDCLEAIPGNSVLARLPNSSDVATEWLNTAKRRSSATTVEIEIPVKLLQRAAALLTHERQWAFLFCAIHSMQTSKTGIAYLHWQITRDVVGGHLDSAINALLTDTSLIQIAVSSAKNITATGYRLVHQPDPKAPSIFSKKTSSSVSKPLDDQEVTFPRGLRHIMASGDGDGGGMDGVKEEEGKNCRFVKLTGMYRVQSVRMLVNLGGVWDSIRKSMSRRWGHIDAAADGAGRLDVISETEAVQIAERHFKDADDENTKAGQRAAAVEFVRYVGSSRDSRKRNTKFRSGRIYIPGLSLRAAARTEIMRYRGEQLWQVDVSGCYWWVTCAEIRRALLLSRSSQTVREQIATNRSIQNVERLICIISSGQFYEFFAEKCGLDTVTVKERINMLCLFNKYDLGGPEFQLIQREWPQVARVIRRLRDQIGGTSTLSRFLNGLEGQLMNGALKALTDAGHAAVRIHDGLAVPEALVHDAMAAIRIQAETRFGIVPGFKIEKPDGTKERRRGEIAADSAGESSRYWELAVPECAALNKLADSIAHRALGPEVSEMAI